MKVEFVHNIYLPHEAIIRHRQMCVCLCVCAVQWHQKFAENAIYSDRNQPVANKFLDAFVFCCLCDIDCFVRLVVVITVKK